jgi:hypothetical protein
VPVEDRMDDLIARFILHRTVGGVPISAAEWEAMPWSEAVCFRRMVQEYNLNRPADSR